MLIVIVEKTVDEKGKEEEIKIYVKVVLYEGFLFLTKDKKTIEYNVKSLLKGKLKRFESIPEDKYVLRVFIETLEYLFPNGNIYFDKMTLQTYKKKNNFISMQLIEESKKIARQEFKEILNDFDFKRYSFDLVIMMHAYDIKLQVKFPYLEDFQNHYLMEYLKTKMVKMCGLPTIDLHIDDVKIRNQDQVLKSMEKYSKECNYPYFVDVSWWKKLSGLDHNTALIVDPKTNIIKHIEPEAKDFEFDDKTDQLFTKMFESTQYKYSQRHEYCQGNRYNLCWFISKLAYVYGNALDDQKLRQEILVFYKWLFQQITSKSMENHFGKSITIRKMLKYIESI